MNLKIALRDEKIFNSFEDLLLFCDRNQLSTIEDFINYDSFQTLHSRITKQFKAIQRILKYKYLGIPLAFDILLDRDYHKIDRQLHNDLCSLGFFVGASVVSDSINKIIPHNNSYKMIDIIINLPEYLNNLKNFYIEYYNSHDITQNLDSPSDENSKEILVALKSELTYLVNQRNELDEKISSLEQQISTLEGGTVTNGRS